MNLKLHTDSLRLALAGVLLTSGTVANAETLTVSQALEMAKKNNATLKAATQDLLASKARVAQAKAAMMPIVTPSVTYVDSVRNVPNAQFGNQTIAFKQLSSEAALSWRVLDAGQRIAQIRSARASESAQESQNRQTMRQILFSVEQNYIESLRAQELEKVASSQLKRAETVLEQTKARVEVKDAARREILQAQADALNATVNAINARNRTTTNLANLKAVIGQGFGESLELEPSGLEYLGETFATVKEAIDTGLQLRPDLASRSRNIDSQMQSLVVTQLDAGVSYALDLSYTRQFSPSVGSNQNLLATISFPLYDGGLRRAIVNQGKASLESLKQQLVQANRDAASEIETAFLTYSQNHKRLEAAKLAQQAAKLNFDSAAESQRLGASDLIEVLTSQVSLVTAEANLIEATYDTLLSQLRLLLVTGVPLPGETA